MSCQPVILDVVSLDFNLNRLKSPFLVHYLTKAHNGPLDSVHLNTFDYFREGLNYFPVWQQRVGEVKGLLPNQTVTFSLNPLNKWRISGPFLTISNKMVVIM